MKKFFLLAVIGFMVSVQAMAQDIKFNENVHEFGKITQNKPATFVFSFTNGGNKPAVIEFASAECGCTTPEYDKAPLMKGKSATVKVTYNAAALGAFSKRVTIKFAGVPEPVILTIKGEVLAPSSKSGR